MLATLFNIMWVLSLFFEENQMVEEPVMLNVDNLSRGDKGLALLAPSTRMGRTHCALAPELWLSVMS